VLDAEVAGEIETNVREEEAMKPRNPVQPLLRRHVEHVAEMERLLFDDPLTAADLTAICGQKSALSYSWTITEYHVPAAYMLLEFAGASLSLTRIGTHPDFQRQGHATDLIGQAIKLAEGRKREYIDAVISESVLPAQLLLRSCGFRCTKIARGKGYLRADGEHESLLRFKYDVWHPYRHVPGIRERMQAGMTI